MELRANATDPTCREALASFARGELSAHMTLIELLIALEDAERVEELLQAQPDASLRAMWSEHREACVAMAAALQAQTRAPAVESEAVDHARRLFDRLVRESEETSVAMHSFGDAAVLGQATDELVRLLQERELLAPDTRVLDLGCGIGRVAAALADRVAEVHGVDVSPAMIEVARRRCAAFENVRFTVSAGADLSEIASMSQSLLLAIDSFPYIVDGGEALVTRMFSEVRRTLVPGGRFVLFNFSYRDDLTRDVQEVRTLAAQHGFTVEVAGTAPLKLWNGKLFLLS